MYFHGLPSGDYYGRLRLHVPVWLQAKVNERELGLRPRLYASYVCVAQRRYSCSMRLVRYVSVFAFAFTIITTIIWMFVLTPCIANHSLRVFTCCPWFGSRDSHMKWMVIE